MFLIAKSVARGASPQLEVSQQPVAGQAAEIHVADMPGPVRIRVTSRGATLFSHDCNDPPCHERFMVPSHGAGSQLEVHVIDSYGGILHDSVPILP